MKIRYLLILVALFALQPASAQTWTGYSFNTCGYMLPPPLLQDPAPYMQLRCDYQGIPGFDTTPFWTDVTELRYKSAFYVVAENGNIWIRTMPDLGVDHRYIGVDPYEHILPSFPYAWPQSIVCMPVSGKGHAAAFSEVIRLGVSYTHAAMLLPWRGNVTADANCDGHGMEEYTPQDYSDNHPYIKDVLTNIFGDEVVLIADDAEGTDGSGNWPVYETCDEATEDCSDEAIETRVLTSLIPELGAYCDAFTVPGLEPWEACMVAHNGFRPLELYGVLTRVLDASSQTKTLKLTQFEMIPNLLGGTGWSAIDSETEVTAQEQSNYAVPPNVTIIPQTVCSWLDKWRGDVYWTGDPLLPGETWIMEISEDNQNWFQHCNSTASSSLNVVFIGRAYVRIKRSSDPDSAFGYYSLDPC